MCSFWLSTQQISQKLNHIMTHNRVQTVKIITWTTILACCIKVVDKYSQQYFHSLTCDTEVFFVKVLMFYTPPLSPLPISPTLGT
jgi:hypothetical protein